LQLFSSGSAIIMASVAYTKHCRPASSIHSCKDAGITAIPDAAIPMVPLILKYFLIHCN